MSFINALTFDPKIIEKLHINIKPFYDNLQKNTTRTCTPDDELLLQQLKTALPSDTENTILNTKHPFVITVDVFSIDIGAVIFQLNENNKMRLFIQQMQLTKFFL